MKMIPETALDHLALHIQQHYKTQTAAAKAWGLGVSYVSAIVNGERPIPQQLLDVIGWEWRLVPKEPQEPRPLGGWPDGVQGTHYVPSTAPLENPARSDEAMCAAPAGVRAPSAPDLRTALQALRDAAEGVKFVALKPQIYTDQGTARHAQRLLAAMEQADAALCAPGVSRPDGETFCGDTPMTPEKT